MPNWINILALILFGSFKDKSEGKRSKDMLPNWISILVIIILLILFFGGRGKISSIMTDLAKGIKSFRKGMSETDEPHHSGKNIEHKKPIHLEVSEEKTEQEKLDR